ncbi:MAG: hypothetical protein A4E65_01066 [Syntrophorhabdus sp. PtaU1.Bin153]|nr:MAG: hypothetical protein A4E65_01066 [Syntrophorhabdus sp. PtaU1.Bin153]
MPCAARGIEGKAGCKTAAISSRLPIRLEKANRRVRYFLLYPFYSTFYLAVAVDQLHCSQGSRTK